MASRSNKLSRFNIAALALGFAFLYLPIVILIIYSFNASRLVTVWGGWSLQWYTEFFNDSAMIDAAWMSLRVGATSATLATLLGQIDRCAPGANAVTKRLIQASRDGPTPAYIEDAARSFAACLRGPEGREGVAAFLEKRAPNWAGPKS